VTNFSPVPHENYQLPFPSSGTWTEIINTDDLVYGGSGIRNNDVVVAESQLATVRIPPLATVWFKRV
jgi:1,4-alpha-glucan branching enzyme